MRRRPGFSRRRVAALVSLVAIALLGVGAWVVGADVQSADQAAARAAPPIPSHVTAEVDQRVLTSTLIMRGDVVPSLAVAVSGPTLGNDESGVVTGVFVKQGDELADGERLLEVSGRPVFVVEGATPAYRTLRPGMAGEDVAQLQSALTSAGCNAGSSGTYDEATKGCVEQFYTDAGYTTLRTSETELTDLDGAAQTVTDAPNELATVQNALARAQSGAEPVDVANAEASLVDAQRAYDTAVAEQPRLVEDAIDEIDRALAAMNAVLAGGSNAAAAGDAGSGSSQNSGAQGFGGRLRPIAGNGDDGTAPPSVRSAAAANLRGSVEDLGEAQAEGTDSVAEAHTGLVTAQATLDSLNAPADVSAEQLAVAQATASVERAQQRLAALQEASGPIIPRGEIVFVSELPARVDDLNAVVGQALGADGSSGASGDQNAASTGPLVRLASPALQVDVPISLSNRDFVSEGMEVELLDEQSGQATSGTLRSIGDDVIVAATSGDPSYPGVIEAAVPPDWSGKNLRVTFTTAATDGPVLVVPAAAVLSSASGTTYVQVEGDDGSTRKVDVGTGVSADGFVAITVNSDAELSEGDRVVIG